MAVLTVSTDSNYGTLQYSEDSSDKSQAQYRRVRMNLVAGVYGVGGAEDVVYIGHRVVSNGTANIILGRGGLVFDASGLPDNASISAVKIKLDLSADNATSAEFDIVVVDGRSMVDPDITAGDYGSLFNKRTSLGSINTSGWSSPYDITLNAAGRALVSVTGLTKFGLRSSTDINGDLQGGADPVAGWSEWVRFHSKNGSGTEPKLEITYTSASPSVNTDAATSITTTGATLNLTLVADGGAAKDCNFEWGRTTNYGNTTAAVSKTTGQTLATALTGLLPNTLYHFRAKADSANGADRTFQTLTPVSGAAPTINSGLVGALRFHWGPGFNILEIGLGGYGRAFSTQPWGHYGAGDPDENPDFSGPPPSAEEICARAQEAYVTYQQFSIHPPIGMTPEERAKWEGEKNRLWAIFLSLNAACSLAKDREGGASGVNR